MDCLDLSSETKKLLLDKGQRFPVPVIEIATALGIRVFADPDYPRKRSGHIELSEDGIASIIVNDKQAPVRKRFTIAHEIAHFQLDSDYLKQHRLIDRDGDAMDATYRRRESCANSFAAHLLMPEDQFVEQWVALGSVEKVADYFGVSCEAARFRAMNLGLMVG